MTWGWGVKAAELWVTIKSLILTSQRGASGKGPSCCKGMTGLFENRKEAPVVGTWEARVR